ncbi:MAG: ABC transporter ATP-binding protein [Deltaproteobacteria bacterium]|nr:ABC transporter ATP-binding protein [Deltaproteobacteria bacterium]
MKSSPSSGWRTSQLGWAWAHARPYRGRIAILAGLSLSEIALRMAAPFAMMVVVDHALGGKAPSGRLARVFAGVGLPATGRTLLVTFVVAGLAMQLAHQLVVMLHNRRSVVIGQSMIRDLRERLFAHVQAATLRHHVATPTGDAVNRLEADTRCVEHIVLRGMFSLVFSVLTLIAMLSVLVAIEPRIAVLALAIVPPLFGWLRFHGRRVGPRADRARRADSHLSSRLFETLASIRLIKSHAREDHELQRFSRAADDSARAWIGIGRAGAVFGVVNGWLTAIGSSAILLVGGMSVLDRGMTLGTLLLALTYVGYVYGPLSAIANTSNELLNSFAGARRVRAAFEVAPECTERPGAIDGCRLRGDVEVSSVAFAYKPGVPVLEDVSFRARPGQLVAIVGPSGAGKSTLAGLVVRFHDVQAGAIRIDGRPIQDYRVRALRRQIALVLQDSVIMSGSVRDNLRYGRPDATDAEIEAAARAAHAHDFIMEMPDGYDTVLEEVGGTLSGGQRQRLSIARAFLKDAPILILDEPTAVLDTLAESQVVDAIEHLSEKRTTLVIAHRLSTVRRADHILVMDRGRIVGSGTHEQLHATNVMYRQLAAQLSVPEARTMAR